MNRLLLLAFLLAMMAVATLGSREEEEDSVARSAREAEPGTRRRGGARSICSTKRCQNNNKCKKRCERRRKKNSSSKKKTSSRRRSGMRRQKTGKKTKCAGTGRADSCEAKVAELLKMKYNKIPNYIRQSERIINANRTGGKKNGKDKVAKFAMTADRIIQAGGGNASALACNGATNGTGAEKLASMVMGLKACAKNIDKACNPMNLPLPNMTEVEACLVAMESFKTAVNACEVATTQDCTCYNDAAITDLQTTIKTCNIKDFNRKMIDELKVCKGNFSACKTMEDDGMKATHACSISTDDLKKDAAALTANSAGLTEAEKTTTALAGNASGSGRQKRAAVTTCTGVIEANTKILALVEMMPTDPMIATLCETITGISGVTCTPTEMGSLADQVASLTEAKASVESALATVQDLLETATGSSASPADIAAAGGATTMSATMASGSRRNIVARHLLNRLNLK